MNVDLIYQKIKAPHLLESKDIELFKNLSEKHPYSQVFSILYLKAMAVNKDLHFEEELQKTAYKITDREKLYNLIHLAENPLNNSIQEKEIIPEMEINLISEVNEEIQETVIIAEEKLESKIEIKEEVVLEVVEEKPLAEEVKIEIPAEIIPEEIKIEEIEKVDDSAALEKEFLSNIVANSYSLEHLEEKIETKKVEVEISPVVEIEEKVDLESERSFTSWLKVNSLPENNSNSLEEIAETPKIEEKELIEEKPKKEFYSASKKAKESVNEEKLLYSETLANIFALQGNYPKAIKAFQQLSLTIPEKKLYFAQKIEELSRKIN